MILSNIIETRIWFAGLFAPPAKHHGKSMICRSTLPALVIPSTELSIIQAHP